MLIAALPELRYLDDRPVFEDDRLCAEAFVQAGGGAGGLQAEREVRKNIKERKEMEQLQNMEC